MSEVISRAYRAGDSSRSEAEEPSRTRNTERGAANVARDVLQHARDSDEPLRGAERGADQSYRLPVARSGEDNDPPPESGSLSQANEELRAPTVAETQGAYALISESRMPYVRMGHWTSLAGIDIHVGYENEQIAGSFKTRAALVELAHVSPGTLAVVASSGNHALAFANEARKRGIPLVAIVPETAPENKVEKIKAAGATVFQHGETYDSAYLYAQQYAHEHGGHFFDVSSATSIAALSTVVSEMLEQVPHADAIVLPAGGGTLLAGGALVAREYARMRGRDILVIGAVPERAATTYESFKADQLVTINPGSTIADATRVMQTDPHLLPTISQHVDEIVMVSENDIQEWVGHMSLFGDPIEGAAAIGIAAIMSSQEGVIKGARDREIDLRGKTVITVATGGNIDASKLMDICGKLPEIERKAAEVKKEVIYFINDVSYMKRNLEEQEARLDKLREIVEKLKRDSKILKRDLRESGRNLPVLMGRLEEALLESNKIATASTAFDAKKILFDQEIVELTQEFRRAYQAYLDSVNTKMSYQEVAELIPQSRQTYRHHLNSIYRSFEEVDGDLPPIYRNVLIAGREAVEVRRKLFATEDEYNRIHREWLGIDGEIWRLYNELQHPKYPKVQTTFRVEPSSSSSNWWQYLRNLR